MRILVSGACGFLGRPLVQSLRKEGHQVVSLVRAKETGPDQIGWDLEKGVVFKEDFEGFDAVVHLAGESISSLRWTKSKKRKIHFSRTVGTMLLSHIFSQAIRPPRVFLSPSAIGYYGDRGEEALHDSSESGKGFLAQVCCEWEKAAGSLADRGTRVVHPRFGVILGKDGGMLKQLLPSYRLGLGATLGTGKQWMSWIALQDALAAISFALTHDNLEGSFVAASPNPVRQEEFSKTLASLLHRPHFLKFPKWLLHLTLGQMADELLLQSAKALPVKLLDAGFEFQMPDLDSALRAAL